MLSLEKRSRLVAIFDYVVRDDGLAHTIEALLSERYEEGRQTSGNSFPLPPADIRNQPRDILDPWQTTWTRAHEIVCSAANRHEVLGKINVYLAANRLWEQAVENFIESLSPAKTDSPRPTSPPQLTLISNGRG